MQIVTTFLAFFAALVLWDLSRLLLVRRWIRGVFRDVVASIARQPGFVPVLMQVLSAVSTLDPCRFTRGRGATTSGASESGRKQGR